MIVRKLHFSNNTKKKKKKKSQKINFYNQKKKKKVSITIKLWGCLVCVFKKLFSVFKQYFMHFNILFHPHISTNIFKQQFSIFTRTNQTALMS